MYNIGQLIGKGGNMNNLQVYTKIDKKIKLYRINLVKRAALQVFGSMAAGVGVSFITREFAPNYAQYFNPGIIASTFYILSSPLFLNKSEDISLYKEIRKELKNGINRFENVNETEFEETLKSYAK